MGQQHAIEQVVITTSGYVTKGSGATALTSGVAQKVAENPDVLGLADIGVVVGIIGVVLGVLVNGISQWLRNRREEEIHRARMEALRNQCAYEG
ncbi:hypothetical protein G8770_03640 [Aestuariicella hydrocarbonica]|uniref:Holin n=1 Tax=Pseudomaricurvus hydrocarbonicus TaxID=1470433 RepID=A0A9E5JQ90_9GAMM|nr:hypothetical protein [Aestuariicella hydrocarbonica]NHO64638.1 hypothetical protein [Aestuariicella hydrocarbonica]